MKRTCCNILNASVGSQKPIPLLSINAVTMPESGGDRGGVLPIPRLINLPLHEQMSCRRIWDAIIIAGAGKGLVVIPFLLVAKRVFNSI